MIQLQNAYGANARVIAAVQAMWDAAAAMRCSEEAAMSGSITMTGVTGYATLARLIADSAATRAAGSTRSPIRRAPA